MALKIITYTRSYTITQPITTHTWNIGDAPFEFIEDIRWIEADELELVHIWELFSIKSSHGSKTCTIPFIFNAQKMTWYGDIAKTIVANL